MPPLEVCLMGTATLRAKNANTKPAAYRATERPARDHASQEAVRRSHYFSYSLGR